LRTKAKNIIVVKKLATSNKKSPRKKWLRPESEKIAYEILMDEDFIYAWWWWWWC